MLTGRERKPAERRIIIILLLGAIAALIMHRAFQPSDQLVEGLIMESTNARKIAAYEPLIIILLVGIVAALIMMGAFERSEGKRKRLSKEPTNPPETATHEDATQPPRPESATAKPARGSEGSA